MSALSRIPRRAILLAVAVCALGAAACDESLQGVETPLPGDDGVPQIMAVTAQSLLAQFGVQLETPIRVRVLDADGRPVRSAVVKYRVLAGSGIFSADSTLTDDQGYTQVLFLPTTTGTVIVEAEVQRPSGTDRVQFTIQVLADPTEATSVTRVSGNGQTGLVGSIVPQPLVVRVINPDGFPVAGHDITYVLQQSQGIMGGVAGTADGPFANQVTVQTDASGLARAFLRLGTKAGPHTVSATGVVGAAGGQATETVTFTATATPSTEAVVLKPISGQTQTVVVDTLHERESDEYRGTEPNPMVVQAVDEFGNPVQGVTVSWFVEDGAGFLAVASSTTNSNGIASNALFEPTVGRNAVVAFVAGADPVLFEITGELYEPPEEEEPADGGGGGGDGGDGGGGGDV